MIIAFCCCLRLVIVDHRFYSRPPASFPWEALGYTYHHQPGKLLVRPRPQRLKIHHCEKDNTRTSWAQISSNKDVKIWEVLQPQQSPFHEDDEDEVARCTLQYAQASADTKSRNDDNAMMKKLLQHFWMLMILFQIAQAVVIKKFNTFVSPKKKVFFFLIEENLG